MKFNKTLLAIPYLLLMASPVGAQLADEDAPFKHPALVPHTQLAWPAHDDSCEAAFRAKNAINVVNACGKVVLEYKDLVSKLAGQDGLDDNEMAYFQYNTAYSEMEVAMGYKKLGSDDTNTTRSLDYATAAMNLCEATVQPIRDIPPSDLTEHQIAAIQMFDGLELRINSVFPDIPVPTNNAAQDE